jgi:hypothetical protein
MVLAFFEIDDLELDQMNPSFIKAIFTTGFIVFSVYIMTQALS